MINLAGYENIVPISEGPDLTLCRAVRGYDDLPVLIKHPNAKLPSPRILAGLKNEYAVSVEIGNTGIVQAQTLHRTDNSLALILEDKGYTLLSTLILHSKTDLRQKIQIAVKMAASMRQLHSKGFLHRNIRPESYAVSPDYTEAVLTNLQNAIKLSESYTATPSDMISEENIAYISPEQSGRINGELDRRSDFYSLGITLFELFTGRRPFAADDALELIHCHLAKEPPAPRHLNAEIPESLSAVILKLLAKNPGDRYQSAHGIKQDLKACLRILGSDTNDSDFTPGHQDISEAFTLSSRLFGRKKEKEILYEAYGKSSLGSCEIIILHGESGCGKTALVRDFNKQVIRERGEFISGKFDQFRRNRPYSALIQAFQDLLRKRLSSPQPVINAWKQRITSALGQNACLITEVLPELELLIGPQEKPAELNSTESRNRFNLAFKNFIKIFPSVDNPLVLFLDDLQWADLSTVQLLKKLVEDQDTSYLMLIGAYRSNQPMANTILTLLNEIEELNANVQSIKLDRLKPRHVHGYISRTLRAERKRTEELSRVVYNRTGGNPLFVREYLRNLYRAELITFNHDKTSWEWDLKAIRDISMDGNLVELMADKIMTQPHEGQQILKAASCIGGKFDLRILMEIVDLPKEIILDYTNIAKEEGLLVSEEDKPPSGRNRDSLFLSFMHDRVQQAAYSMLNAAEKTDIHIKIGRTMIRIFDAEELRESVFEIAAQYSFGISEISDQEERNQVSLIFSKAGRKAKRSSAYELAAKYLSTAVRLTDTTGWTADYDNTFNLYLDWYECEFLNGAIKHSEKVFRSMIKHALNRRDITRANLSKMLLFSDQSRYHEAVKIGLHTLENYNINIPERPGKTAITAELLKTRIVLGSKNADKLYHLPDMENPEHLETMQLFMNTIAPAYMFNKKLVFYIVLRMIRFSIRYGNAPASSFAYIFYAMLLAARDYSFDKSKEFSRLAVDLIKKFKASELETKIYMIKGGMHDHWHLPLQENIETLDKAFRSGLMRGDNTYARYAGYFAVYDQFLRGESIAEVYDAATKYSNFIRKNNNSLSNGAINITIQMCKSMEGKTYTPGYLDDDNFREATLLSMAKSSGSEVLEIWTVISKIITLSFFGYHSKAIEYIEPLIDNVERKLFGMYYVPVFRFFSIVNMAAVFNDCPAKKQKLYLSRIKDSLSKLKRWSAVCPDNFRHMYLLARAEYSRLTGQLNHAIFSYEEAVNFCVNIGSHNFAGLSCELAAKFHSEIGGRHSATALYSEACSHYRRWGASAKVQRLIHDNHMLQDTPDSLHVNEGTKENKGTQSLDISAVVKASQAISGEIVLDRLLDKLMRIVIENAGAQKATLLLNNKNSLELTAYAFVSEHGITTQIVPDPNQDLYCKSIVNYVLRSKDNIVLRDAGTQGPFTIDSYIIRSKPKSILAMPVINQQIMRGVLYLENNLSPGVFTDDRLEVLNLLCSQAAISIQNARLYSDLRDSETQHRTLLESINVGAFRAEANIDGCLIKGNRALAEMFGYNSWNDFRMTQVRSLYANPDMHQTILNELSKGDAVRDREVNMHKHDGTPIWVNITASLQREGNSRTEYLEGILEDITEKRKARELEKAKVAADAANKAKSDFLASMSHEIRTPMNAILGMAELLWESRLNKTQRNYVKIFKNAGENLLLLINDILDLSKIEAGQITLEAIDFNLEELFEEVGSIFAHRAQAKNINLCWYLSAKVPRIINGDPTRIRQILVNLVGNALKFTKEGVISYEADMTETGLLRVIIRDTGVGIPGSKMNSVFDTFSQADSSTTRNFGGTGLGLSICSRMVASMNGGIFVSSEEGKGSSFAFTIRIATPNQRPMQKLLESTSILIVDSCTRCSRLLGKGLTDMGANVHLAKNISEALITASEMSLVDSSRKVLAVGKPAGKKDRFEVLKIMKKEICKSWKLILFMEARPESRTSARVKQLGASYIQTPIHPMSVADEIINSHSEHPENIMNLEFECSEIPANNIDKAKVLLIEDSEDNRMLIDLFLKEGPYDIDYAENGRDGLVKYIAGDYDMVLMDIQMPIMDGYEATKAIRRYEQDNNKYAVPILALTANAFQEDAQKCLDCGCNDHMAKPIKKKKLLRALENFIGLETES